MGTRLPARLLLKKELIYGSMRLHARLLGHLSPVFCVKFDQTGRYIFTGADDNLVKVGWFNSGESLSWVR
jgi:WD40 repeat protein